MERLRAGRRSQHALDQVTKETAYLMSIIEFGQAYVLPVADLSRREEVVLAHLAQELTLDEVAKSLFVSRNTVKSQVRSLYRKLGVTCRADAVARARWSLY
jgi:DNA-binding CsgD family transcriptional regulator